MKMAKRRLKKLEEMTLRTFDKPTIKDQPSNRAERRALERFNRLGKKREKDIKYGRTV